MDTRTFITETKEGIKRSRNAGQCERLFERACNEVCAPHGLIWKPCTQCPVNGCFKRIMKDKFGKEIKD